MFFQIAKIFEIAFSAKVGVQKSPVSESLMFRIFICKKSPRRKKIFWGIILPLFVLLFGFLLLFALGFGCGFRLACKSPNVFSSARNTIIEIVQLRFVFINNPMGLCKQSFLECESLIVFSFKRNMELEWGIMIECNNRNLHFDCQLCTRRARTNSCHALRMGRHSLFLVAHAPDVWPWMASQCPIAFKNFRSGQACTGIWSWQLLHWQLVH